MEIRRLVEERYIQEIVDQLIPDIDPAPSVPMRPCESYSKKLSPEQFQLRVSIGWVKMLGVSRERPKNEGEERAWQKPSASFTFKTGYIVYRY